MRMFGTLRRATLAAAVAVGAVAAVASPAAAKIIGNHCHPPV